jgi:hypothetical protein
VRRLISDATGEPYVALSTLAEAKAAPDGVVILEGDYGGQIYVVARAIHVQCSDRSLQQLLSDLDKREWCDPEGAYIYFERRAVGEGVAGGMGGGEVTERVWVHPRLSALASMIEDVLLGRRSVLGEDEQPG